MTEIYLDHNATTPPDPLVVDAMLPYLRERFGNAASSHARGRSAKAVVDAAREQVAELVGGAPGRLVWTSGATESLNQVIQSWAAAAPHSGRPRIVYTAGEHKAVLDTVEWCAATFPIEPVVAPLQPSSEVQYEALESLVDDRTGLVVAMAANNETGVLNDLRRIAEFAHAAGSTFLCDATQQAGKLPLDLTEADADFAAISGHKLYGPQGIGALLASRTPWLQPLIRGGGHQGGLRSGTLNVPGIVGFGTAAEFASKAIKNGEPDRVQGLRDRLEALLIEQAAPVVVHGREAPRLPNTTNLRIVGVDADALIVNCPDVAMSSGSACTSAVPTTSHVLRAMGLREFEAEESVRLSLGRGTIEHSIDSAVKAIAAAVARIREVNA